MPLQNRVTPFGELIATPARGTLMGNRGGRIHTDARKLTGRCWASRQWICCVLDFKGRKRDVWGRYYTELFFLDEVTAFAAGHRPCFECRRRDADRFAELFSTIDTHSVHSRKSGNPGAHSRAHEIVALDPRVRGDGWRRGSRATAKRMDVVLHAERLDGKQNRLHPHALDALPDGAMIVRDGDAFALRGGQLLKWTPSGYRDGRPRPHGVEVRVLTPPSILAVLERGYAPLWHASAG